MRPLPRGVAVATAALLLALAGQTAPALASPAAPASVTVRPATGWASSALHAAHDGSAAGTRAPADATDAVPATDPAPTTAPVLTSPAPGDVSGDVTLAATSDAPTVQFLIDGTAFGSPVSVVDGTATTSWSTWGLQDTISHDIVAQSCTDGGCGPGSDPVQVVVENTPPTLTAPNDGQVYSGSVPMAATAEGGAIEFLIDGERVAFDTTAPYEATVSLSAFADGIHSAQAVPCDAAGEWCAGEPTEVVHFESRSLHPYVTSILPSPFSPNGDGRRDTTKVTYKLPEGGTASYVIRNAAGQVAVSRSLGTLAAGWHNFVWKGRNANGDRVHDGALSVTINVSKVVDGLQRNGMSAPKTVRVDDTAPALSSVSGRGATIYPYRDGYRDSFTPAVTVSEPGTLTLVVRNSAGRIVRQLSTSHGKAGRFGILWAGRTASGTMVPAGTYRFGFVATDVAGNRRTLGGYRVYVSAKRLVTKSATVVKTARQAYSWESTNSNCATAQLSSSFPGGVLMRNRCSVDNAQLVIGYWRATVPAATRYLSLGLATRGFTPNQPTLLIGVFHDLVDDTGDVSGAPTLRSGSTKWWGLGSVHAARHISSGRVADFAVALPTVDGKDDFAMASVRLVVRYQVLR